jgi:hypothetical protein
MNDIIKHVLTNTHLLMEITKWHIFHYFYNNKKQFINIICQTKNYDKLNWLINNNYITYNLLDKIVQQLLPKSNYITTFSQYAYFCDNKHFPFPDINIEINFESYEFIKLYNILPSNNIFNEEELLTFPFEEIKKKVFNDMNVNCINHCISVGNYGTQYDLDKLDIDDNSLKFLFKTNNVTFKTLDKFFNKRYHCLNESILYIFYKNYYNTLEYVLSTFPNKCKKINGSLVTMEKVLNYLIQFNIEIIVVLLENNITSIHDTIIKFFFINY